jgi:hypothetical protein
VGTTSSSMYARADRDLASAAVNCGIGVGDGVDGSEGPARRGFLSDGDDERLSTSEGDKEMIK